MTDSSNSGAGSSKGKASWTGKAEILDYISFVGFFVQYLDGLKHPTDHELVGLSNDSANTSPTSSFHAISSNPHFARPPRVKLLLGGYSYGSLITCCLPPIEDILGRFSVITPGTAEDEIRLRALNLSLQWKKIICIQHETQVGCGLQAKEKPAAPDHSISFAMGGEEADLGSRRLSRESRSMDIARKSIERTRRSLGLRKSSNRSREHPSLGEGNLLHTTIHTPEVYYLLVSPLLPPVSLLATMFSRLSIHDLLPSWSVLASESQKCHQPVELLTGCPTLAVYGKKDIFTSQKKLREWAERLANTPQSSFQFREIAGAGHFWQEEGVETQMRSSIREWLQNLLKDMDKLELLAYPD